MAIIVERINQMIECDREIIETLKDIKSHVNKQMNIRKRWKAYSSRAVIFGGTVSMGAILFAPFTAGASLVLLDVGAPAIVGGIAGNKTLNVLSALNDNGIIDRIKRCAKKHDEASTRLQVVAENMCKIVTELMETHKLEKKSAIFVITVAVITGFVEIAEVIITANAAKSAANDLIKLMEDGLQWKDYLKIAGCAVGGICLSIARHRLSDSENEVARAVASLIGLGIVLADQIKNDSNRMPLVFGFGVANIFFPAFEQFKIFNEFVETEHKAIPVIKEFTNKLQSEINALRQLTQNNNY